MNRFLLDTNVLSETVGPTPDARVTAWIEAQALENLFLSVVTPRLGDKDQFRCTS